LFTVNHKVKYQAMKFGGRINYCRTANEVERASMELIDKIKAKNGLGEVPLGFDIEWRPSFRRGLFACTIHCFTKPLLIAS
jgi:werner syndrome-like exonuclease